MKRIKVKDFPFDTFNSFLFLKNYSEPIKHLNHAYLAFFSVHVPHPLPNGDYLFHKCGTCAQLVLHADDDVFLFVEE